MSMPRIGDQEDVHDRLCVEESSEASTYGGPIAAPHPIFPDSILIDTTWTER